MFKMKVILLTCFLLSVYCGHSTSDDANVSYLKEIQQWKNERLLRLKAPDSWLSLAGLFWLEEGENTFGGGPDNDFVIHSAGIPERVGIFVLQDGSVRFKASAAAEIYHDHEPVQEIILEDDSNARPTVLKLGSLSWFVIRRGDRLGIRVKDAEHPRIQKLKEIDMFPIDSAWRVKAVFEKYETPRIVKTPTVLGQVEEQPCPGVLVFQIGSKTFRLYPFAEQQALFLVFGDLTNTHETYGGGRFLVVDKPDERGNCWIDFNKSYNPPCVFSPFATCPLPPGENQLPVRISAGEMMVSGFGH